MGWTLTRDLDSYLTVAGDAVRAQSARNTIVLTVGDALQRRGLEVFGDDPSMFGWWTGADGRVDGALVWTPPRPPVVGVIPAEAVGPLAEVLVEAGARGINAERNVAEAVAEAWRRDHGVKGAVVMEQRLHRLVELISPDPAPPGRPRIATADDRALAMAWMNAFYRDVNLPSGDTAQAVDDLLSYSGLTLWEVDGTPVSMAGAMPLVAGTTRITLVYTPDSMRGRGYAAAVTATVSQAALDADAEEVLLFTDLSNPTSSRVYQRIGYRPVVDWLLIEASPPDRLNQLGTEINPGI